VSEPLRVLIADDHAPTRASVREALEEEGFVVTGEAADAPAAVAAAIRDRPDVCLLDIRMPGSGVAAAWEITSRLPETRVIMLTVSRRDADLFAALRAGARGYLLKDTDPARVPEAIRGVVAGEAALPGSLVARVIREFRERSPRRRLPLSRLPSAEPLTSREWEVLELLREGASTAEISRTLSVTPATVRTHVTAILRKLRARDRQEAVRLLDER
jgi:DNA-binding NarL/FixJ family response regulator